MKNEIQIISQNSEESIKFEILNKKHEITLEKLFTEDGMNKFLTAIENDAKSFVADVTTKDGQKEIKSLAYKVSQFKAPIEEVADKLKENSKQYIKGVNERVNVAKTRIDALRDLIRKPVDDIEEAEKKFEQERNERIFLIEGLKNELLGSLDLDLKIESTKNDILRLNELVQFDWQIFSFKVATVGKEVLEILTTRLKSYEDQKAKDAELEQLRKEKEERERKDREEEIAREAAEKARNEADERAEKESKRKIAEHEAQLAAEEARRIQIQQDKERAEAEKIAAENRAKEAERLAKEQAAQAEERRITAEKKAKEDAEKAAQAAIEAERERIRQEAELVRRETEKREANKKHRAKINNEALNSIADILTSSIEPNRSVLYPAKPELIEAAKLLVEAIAKGEVPNVSINY